MKQNMEVDHEGEMAAGGDLEAARERSHVADETSEPGDPFLVEWSGPDDPANPLNFSIRRKRLLMFMIASIAFLTYGS